MRSRTVRASAISSLDCFGGSGSTLLAAERTGRRARVIEFEPRFVDVTIERYEELTGTAAVEAGSGLTFAQMKDWRVIEGPMDAGVIAKSMTRMEAIHVH